MKHNPAMSPMVRCVSLVLGMAALGAPALPARQQPPRPPFAAKTELVIVDFVVTDKTGRPVRGLTSKDFVVKEDGKERPIVAFEAFAGDAPPAPPSSGAPPEPLRGSAGDALPAGPATVILVDDGHLSPEQATRLRPALKALLKRLTERSGVLMLVAPLSKVSVAGVLPADAPMLAAAADRIVGQRVEAFSRFPISDAEAIAIERGDRRELARVAARFVEFNPTLSATQATSLALARASEVVRAARIRRDVAHGVTLLCLDWLEERAGRHGLIIVSGGYAEEPGDQRYQEVVARSMSANAPVHFLDARGLRGIGRYDGVEYGQALSQAADEGPFAWDHAAGGSTRLADDTGGIAVRNASDMARGLEQILESMTTYYVLAYEPPPHDKEGFKKIKVEARGRGLQVRARRGYYSGGPRYSLGRRIRN